MTQPLAMKVAGILTSIFGTFCILWGLFCLLGGPEGTISGEALAWGGGFIVAGCLAFTAKRKFKNSVLERE